jgi:hypothetical protein
MPFVPSDKLAVRLNFGPFCDQQPTAVPPSIGENLNQSVLKGAYGLKVLAEAIQQGVKFSSRFTLKDDHVRKDSMRPGIVLASLLAQFCTWTVPFRLLATLAVKDWSLCGPKSLLPSSVAMLFRRFTKDFSTGPPNGNNSNGDPSAACILGTIRRSCFYKVTNLPRVACGPVCILGQPKP